MKIVEKIKKWFKKIFIKDKIPSTESLMLNLIIGKCCGDWILVEMSDNLITAICDNCGKITRGTMKYKPLKFISN